ncbi:hypothetical protein [Nocardioides acrostichi]|uniref:Uncharacterized protein n=1 Tax=Nocardioides acrostichi TaxID=2784339 RepID=A0A930V521_9ACTN|nr:hypothetical protein [Nocardioides acrostichi]MBF4163981.1 hypothetical protein [Nocardioides acrostichi]
MSYESLPYLIGQSAVRDRATSAQPGAPVVDDAPHRTLAGLGARVATLREHTAEGLRNVAGWVEPRHQPRHSTT